MKALSDAPSGMVNRKAQPRIDDVAHRAGVSISTVSRVVNRTVPVSDQVAARVQSAMKELKYVPRAAARNLASRRTNTLGLLLTDLLGDFFAPLLSGIESVAVEQGFGLLISTAGRGGPHFELPGPLGRHNSDGLLVFAGALADDGIISAHEQGLPLVLVHQTPPSGLLIPSVTIENKAASRDIVTHLIEVHGRRRIVLLQGPVGHEDAHWRQLGYREALAAHGLPFDPALVRLGDFDRHEAQASMGQLVESDVAFDAVFAGDDEAAVGALQALRAARRRVPQEVAVVGFDDQRLAAVLDPPLTTVHAPTEEVGRIAAQHLIHLIRTGEARPLTLLPTQIVLRRSCGCDGETA